MTRIYGTVMSCSLEGMLVPHAFWARTRTKYVPGGAGVPTDVTGPAAATNRSDRPGADPTSTIYEGEGDALAGGVHASVTWRSRTPKMKSRG